MKNWGKIRLCCPFKPNLFRKTATMIAFNPKSTHKQNKVIFNTNAFNEKVDAAFLLLSVLI